jgi:hypothetical protein
MLIPLTDSFLVLFLAFCSVSVQVAAQAVPGLSGFNYTYSGQPDFPAASEACESKSLPYMTIILILDLRMLVNLRYTYVPRLVAYPVTIEHVSQIVRVAYESKVNVVARSGGVCFGLWSPSAQKTHASLTAQLRRRGTRRQE